MLPSAQLCSAVTAREDVSVGTHTRVTSGLKAWLWMQLFMPFKCYKSKRHTGRVGDWQTSCYRDENIALCVAGTDGVKRREEHRQLTPEVRSPSAQAKQVSQAQVRLGYQWHLTNNSITWYLLFRYCSCFLLFFLSFPFLSHLFIHWVPLCDRPTDLL